jgi:sortase A
VERPEGQPGSARNGGDSWGWLLAERTAWLIGVVALLTWGAARIAGIVGARADKQRFEAAATAQPASALESTARPDVRLWDENRVRAWRASLMQPVPAPLAVLRIPKIQLDVAVLPGTGELTLNRGLGHIDGTAAPGADGNSGIAGHRDGFFRGLKDLTPGDRIELETIDGLQTYRVDRIWVVAPEDVSVLDPTPVRALTLVTCYPFYFIGPAPQRFIVRAVSSGTPRRVSRR